VELAASPVQRYLESLHADYAGINDGEVATYIPELGKADPAWFSLCVVTVDGHVYAAGDSEQTFSIQSVSKPFVYGMALEDRGVDEVLERVGVEPTGDPFNSIVVDEASNRPFNPMVNAGAIVTTRLVAGEDPDTQWSRICRAFAAYTGRTLDLDNDVYLSELATGDRNRAIAYLMRNFGMLEGDVDAVLSLYFRQCSLLVTCRDLAIAAATLANGGVNPISGARAIPERHVEHVLSVMQTCGMYDYAGAWTYEVGLPAKSGVSGGVIAVLPGQIGVGVFSPPLDARGNSVRGIEVCRRFARDFALHPHRARSTAADVVRRRYTGHRVRSTLVRTMEECEAIEEYGDEIIVFELQGNLYFADAEQLVRQVLAGVDDARVVVLDGERLGRVDPPAITLLIGLADTIASTDRVLVTAGFPPSTDGPIDLGGITAADVDDALEWWEESILAKTRTTQAASELPLASQELLRGVTPEQLVAIESTVAVTELGVGEYLAYEGDQSDCVYFLLAGRISVRLQVEGHATGRRVAGFGPGVSVGELALLDESPRSADLVVERPARVASLSVRDLEDLDLELPGLKATVYANLAHSLSERLRRANGRIRALEQ
jgi:glutaminase